MKPDDDRLYDILFADGIQMVALFDETGREAGLAIQCFCYKPWMGTRIDLEPCRSCDGRGRCEWTFSFDMVVA